MCGGIMFGAWFMATDYATTPITKKGQILFGICCGFMTFLFRTIGGTPEGVSYAIILSNLLVPLIEKITVPRAFGVVKVKKEGK
jgi:Na+-translocating ferredoxin:NAD+ oxidoreductase RnfD subunit